MALRKTRRLIVALLCLVVWPGTTHGQPSEIKEAYYRYSKLYAQGRYEEALPFAKQALNLGEEEFGPDHPHAASFLNNLAQLYVTQGRFAEAEPLDQRTLAIREKAPGPEHLDVAQIQENYAALLRMTGSRELAMMMELRAKANDKRRGHQERGAAERLDAAQDVAAAPEPIPREFADAEGAERECVRIGIEAAQDLHDAGKISLRDLLSYLMGIGYVCERISEAYSAVDAMADTVAALTGSTREPLRKSARALYFKTYEISDVPYRAIDKEFMN